jgi:hypothetical protein
VAISPVLHHASDPYRRQTVICTLSFAFLYCESRDLHEGCIQRSIPCLFVVLFKPCQFLHLAIFQPSSPHPHSGAVQLCHRDLYRARTSRIQTRRATFSTWTIILQRSAHGYLKHTRTSLDLDTTSSKTPFISLLGSFRIGSSSLPWLSDLNLSPISIQRSARSTRDMQRLSHM